MIQNKPLYSVEAERSVIGSILLDGDLVSSVSEIVCADDFFRPEHCIIFNSILSLADSCESIDVVTVSEWIDKNNSLDDIGGIGYLLEIADSTPSASNVLSYAEIVKERAILRRIAALGSQVSEVARDRDGMTSAEMIEETERQLAALSESQAKAGDLESIGDILIGAVNGIDERFNNGETVTGIKTGLSDFDEFMGGLQDTDLIILGGRPAMGKTSLAINMAENAAINEGKVVAVFSIEMPKVQLANRMISSIGRIDQGRIKTGKLEDSDWSKIMMSTLKLKKSKLFIDDTSGISPSYARNKLKKIEREHGGVDLVVIDYLQLMQIPNYKEGRTNEISEISRSLKAMAKEFNCPVIALSQLNRGLETRPNKRPINSDLRESGAIEQDADIIMFVYRDEVYNEDSPHKGIAEIIIGKHRNGEIGTVRAAFQGKYSRFENLTTNPYDNY